MTNRETVNPEESNVAPVDASGSATDDVRLAELLEELTAKRERGESVDIEIFRARYPELADRLEGLFATLDVIHRLGDSSASDATNENSSVGPLDPGATLGDFHIEREIDRGGMGVVYEATQISLSRRVALKVLPFAALLDSRQIQRFRNEAHAAAQLHHSHIVPVHAVGCERGVHYYAMQYIEGRSLDVVIAELARLEGEGDHEDEEAASKALSSASRALLGAPHVDDADSASRDQDEASTGTTTHAPLHDTGGLTPRGSTRHPSFFRGVARLAVDVAGALEHAHEVGVIHRDVKPSNLIIDDRGHVWLADFGLARTQLGGDLTATGDVVGTLR